MEKSKLGISLNLYAAFLYFLGAIGSWGILAMIIATGYILLSEENDKLKKTAVKALILVIFLTILTVLITLLTTWWTIIIIPHPELFYFSITTWQAIMRSIDTFIRIISILVPIIYGLRAYKQKDIKIKWIDNILDNHLFTEILKK